MSEAEPFMIMTFIGVILNLYGWSYSIGNHTHSITATLNFFLKAQFVRFSNKKSMEEHVIVIVKSKCRSIR